jgi:alpha-amylase
MLRSSWWRPVRLLAWALCFLVSPLAGAGPLDGGSGAVMLQGFHWESHETYPWWNTVAARADDIAGSGFHMVWLPPSGRSAGGAIEGYLPNELYTQTGGYGTEQQLKSLISALKARNVKVLADVVINHRVGTNNWADFTLPTWGADAVCRGDEWAGATGNPDTGAGFNAGRDIDHTQGYVRQGIIDWLNWMKGTIGYDGWRYDYVRGYSGTYVGTYNAATTPYFSVGELWDNLDLNNPNPHRQQIINWIDATGGSSAAFDFTTKGLLQQAVQYNEYWRMRDSNGKPAGVIGWWPARSVTFVDNHDTGPSPGGTGGQNHWPFPSGQVMQGYAYILTHPGIPTVYWPHFFDWGLRDAIRALMQVRSSQGLTSTSTVAIQVADSSRYAAIIDNKVAMKIGPGAWSPGTGWTPATSGTNYAVWTKSTPPPPPPGKVRTVIYILRETQPGQDIFIRGGHDQALVNAGHYASASENITYLNTKNTTTASLKASDATLDWSSDSALDWTCNAWPAAWGTPRYYATDGYGQDPENTRGLHWWKFDVMMDGQKGDWFEFKAFLRQNGTTQWEPDIRQAGTPFSTINHWGKKGHITFVTFGQSQAEFVPLP